MRASSILALLLVAACGSRTGLQVGGDAGFGHDGTAGDAPSPDATPPDAGPFDPCLVDRIRMCGPGCPPLGSPPCCTAAYDRSSGTPANAGACWLDLPDPGQRDCAGYEDGEACVYRAPNRLICVPEGVCRALFAMGATRTCRYADKSAYDGRSLAPPPTSCPVGTDGKTLANKGSLCGGACGKCAGGNQQPCTGRSADRAFGICPIRYTIEPVASVDKIQRCSSNADCPGTSSAFCAVFRVGVDDQTEARSYGGCMVPVWCTNAAIAGQVTCF